MNQNKQPHMFGQTDHALSFQLPAVELARAVIKTASQGLQEQATLLLFFLSRLFGEVFFFLLFFIIFLFFYVVVLGVCF